MNTGVRAFPVSVPHLHRLIHLAWQDVKDARHRGDTTAALRAERRMNTLLDQLTSRTSALAS